jgi:hypothetical protein
MNENPEQVIELSELPAVITRYLRAHRDHDTATALGAFAAGATVVDEGNTYTGTAAIEKWLDRSASEYTYTVELTAAHKSDGTHYTATQHLAGNFPGGEVDLRYRITLREGLIESLTIAP